MGKGRRLGVITAILKINASCSVLINNCADKVGHGQKGAENRVQKRRLQEPKLKKHVSDSVHSEQHHGGKTRTGCSPELKQSTPSSQGLLTNL